MSKRNTANQVQLPAVPKPNIHQKRLNQMHDALYALSNQVSPIPKPSNGVTNLLPKSLQNDINQNNKLMAGNHINTLYQGFKAAAKTHLPKGQNNG